jgi:hypothetical protein
MHNTSLHFAPPGCAVRLCKVVLVLLSLEFVYDYHNGLTIKLYLAKGKARATRICLYKTA